MRRDIPGECWLLVGLENKEQVITSSAYTHSNSGALSKDFRKLFAFGILEYEKGGMVVEAACGQCHPAMFRGRWPPG
jgi:hypothetical protein